MDGALISSSFGDLVFHSAGSGFKGFGLDFKDTDFKTACYKKTEKELVVFRDTDHSVLRDIGLIPVMRSK